MFMILFGAAALVLLAVSNTFRMVFVLLAGVYLVLLITQPFAPAPGHGG